MQFPLQSVDELQKAVGFGFDDRFHHQLPTGIDHGDHNRFLVHVHSDIFNVTTHVSCLLGGKIIPRPWSLSLKVKMPSIRTAFLVADVNHPESGALPALREASIL